MNGSIGTPETTENLPTRRDFGRWMGASALGLGLVACGTDSGAAAADTMDEPSSNQGGTPVPAQTADSQAAMTPSEALDLLRSGNQRFVAGTPVTRDLAAQVQSTASGQYPFAVVLGCIDSRVPIETVFDQGIGDVFAARVAGNVVNPDLLGSMEFACNLAGSKVVMVLGHTDCGAVKGAIGEARLGNLTGLVQKIEPAVVAVDGERDVNNNAYVDQVAETNVMMTLDNIRSESEVLAGMEASGDILLVGAMYDISTGEVRFL